MNNKIKSIGTIGDVKNIEVTDGRIEMYLPVDVISEQLDSLIEEECQEFKKKYPEVETPCMELRLEIGFSSGEFEYNIFFILFDGENQDKSEIYGEYGVELTEEQQKAIKKAAWDNLGKYFLGI